MKQIFLISFTVLMLFFAIDAQTSEQVSRLTPVASNIGKFSKRLSPDRNRIIYEDNLEFEVSTELVTLPENKKGVVVTIKTLYRELVFQPEADKQTTKVKIYGRITSKDKSTDGFFEEIIFESARIEELMKGVNKEIVLRKVFELPKGNYQIGVIVKDIASGNRGIQVSKFKVS